MQQTLIFQPFMATMLLTFVVWQYMYYRRNAYLIGNQVDLRKVDTPEKAAQTIPYEFALPAHNLKNLFELPPIFYALCIFLYVTESVDQFHLIAAWWFFAFRLVHSFVHCTYNKVMHRFAAYFLSSIGLWIIFIRAAVSVF